MNTTSTYSQMFGNDSNSVKMPAIIADTEEKFLYNFYNLPKYDWEKRRGDAYVHILAYELDELILNTPGMDSWEIEDLKTEMAEYIKMVCETDIARAYKILHKVYVPTEEQYTYLIKKEYGRDAVLNPVIYKGVYESVEPENKGWFNFALNKWNRWHDALANNEPKESEISKYSKSIKDEWEALTEDERLAWADRVVE